MFPQTVLAGEKRSGGAGSWAAATSLISGYDWFCDSCSHHFWQRTVTSFLKKMTQSFLFVSSLLSILCLFYLVSGPWGLVFFCIFIFFSIYVENFVFSESTSLINSDWLVDSKWTFALNLCFNVPLLWAVRGLLAELSTTSSYSSVSRCLMTKIYNQIEKQWHDLKLISCRQLNFLNSFR